MLPLITTKIKDDILHWLCANVPLGSVNIVDHTELLNEIGIDFFTLEAVLDNFAEMGLISSLDAGRTEEGALLIFSSKVKAHDLVQEGGFAVIDALNEANVQKILFELKSLEKQLKPDQLDAYNKIVSIASSIATVLTAYSGRE